MTLVIIYDSYQICHFSAWTWLVLFHMLWILPLLRYWEHLLPFLISLKKDPISNRAGYSTGRMALRHLLEKCSRWLIDDTPLPPISMFLSSETNIWILRFYLVWHFRSFYIKKNRSAWKMKVIGAGFGRTGTSSLQTALEILGFGPCYHMNQVLRKKGDISTKIFWRVSV